jgi:hypothetical protein
MKDDDEKLFGKVMEENWCSSGELGRSVLSL